MSPIKNTEIKGRLAEIAAEMMAKSFDHAISPGRVEVIDYDIDYDIIFVTHPMFNAPITNSATSTKLTRKRYAIEPSMFDKTADSAPVVEMLCRCRTCKRNFYPAPSAVIHEHDCNNQSYGPTSIEQTLNTFEFCASCAGDIPNARDEVHVI